MLSPGIWRIGLTMKRSGSYVQISRCIYEGSAKPVDLADNSDIHVFWDLSPEFTIALMIAKLTIILFIALFILRFAYWATNGSMR